MFDQRNQQFQTIILSSSVMFSALSTVIIQGPLNPSASSNLVILYSFSSSMSFALLFMSIVLCIETISRASKFMYARARKQTLNLKNAIVMSQNAIIKLRADKLAADLTEETSGADGEEIEREWAAHEATVYKFLQERENINKLSAEESYAGAGGEEDRPSSGGLMSGLRRELINPGRMSFERFWKERCAVWGDLAIFLFYTGSISFMLAVMCFMWSQFGITYASRAGAQAALILLALGLIAGLFVVIGLRREQIQELVENVPVMRPVGVGTTGMFSSHRASHQNGSGSASSPAVRPP
jgi:hypothetical protein